ncbi:uncharacterized protein C6orf47 homolog [Diretmus argenteus]
MTAVIGRVWGWVRPWGGGTAENTTTVTTKEQKTSGWGVRGLTSWVWGRCKSQSDKTNPVEEYWEAQEKLQPVEIEDLRTMKPETEAKAEHVPRWWNKIRPSSYVFWWRKTESSGLRQRKGRDAWDSDNEDYGTPPPSPTHPSSHSASPFRFFPQNWEAEVVPEHYEICFNFLRHLFDLFVVGFLWTVSPPTKLILEVLGVQGALRLWFHGMAMFFVSTVGMAGLLWLIQEYLPQFALIYGIVQALVISVSIRQSVILGEEEEKEEEDCGVKEGNGMTANGEHKEKHVSAKDKIKP